MNEWVALVTDQHFGVRNNSQIFLEYQLKFYEDVFFPALEEYNVEDIIDLGDTFDRRKSIDFNILHQVREKYYRKLQKMQKTIYMIVGNHTAYYKNTNRINTLNLVLNDFDNVVIVEDPEVIRVNEMDVLMMPWINEENKEHAFTLLEEKHKYCFGHLEINGFEMFRGQVHRDGEFDSHLFSNVENVFSGHFHRKNKKGNIMYLGNPYQLTWGDYGDVRGFHLINLQTGELKFIENPYQMFHTIEYTEAPKKIDFEKYRDTYVKVICRKKGSVTKFQNFIKKLLSCNPIDVIIIENENTFEIEDIEDFEEENTAEICKSTLHKYVAENSIINGVKIEKKILKLLDKAEREVV
jgi:DNA repair exonuclease SbcCD nuclease subunit